MTEKDYIKLAQALKDSKPLSLIISSDSDWNNRINQWHHTETITMTLQHDNKSFDKARFLNACGYNS